MLVATQPIGDFVTEHIKRADSPRVTSVEAKKTPGVVRELLLRTLPLVVVECVKFALRHLPL